MHRHPVMPTPPTPKAPMTYDEITRRTVPEPDGSWRPSPEQVRQAYEGHRAMDSDEQALHERVAAAIARTGITVDKLAIEVARDRVIVRGSVPFVSHLDTIERAIHGVDGVGDLVDHLVVA